MGNTRLKQVEVDSTDLTSFLIKGTIKEDFGNPIYEATLEFARSVSSLVTFREGQTVEIWTGYTTSQDLKRFQGELISHNPEAGKIIVKASNDLYQTVRRTINAKIYDKSVVGDPINPDGKLSDAFTDIISTYTSLTADSSSVTDSGTAITLTKFICDHTDPKERLDKLAEALNWHYYYKASDDKVYFEPKQTTVNSNTLTVGSNVVNVPKWKYDKSDLINDLRLDGVFQQNDKEDLFTGDASETEFTLSSTPVGDVAIYVNNAKNYSTASPTQNELQTLGVENATAGSFDYTVDKSTKIVTFESGSVPGAGTNNILARYSAVEAVPVHLRNDVSYADPPSGYGPHERTMQLTDVITVDDAEARVQEVIDRFKDPFQSAVLNVKNTNGVEFEVGEQIRVVDTTNQPNVDGDFVIFGIERNLIGGFDVVKVGDREFDPPEYFINVSERIHRLERELISDDVVLTELELVTFPVTVEPDGLTVTAQYLNDSFILDNSVNGVLYDADETSIVDDFEDATDWSEGSGSETLTIANNSTAGQFWIGSQGVKASWVASSGTAIIENTDAQGDLSSVTGVASGTPSQGTGGVWAYTADASDITSVTLRIGSSSSDYKEYLGQTYAQKVAGTEGSFALVDSVRVYILFDLDSPDATSGTVDWTAIDFVQLRVGIAAAGDVTFDYLTVSKNNTIALNGLGERYTTYTEEINSY